MKKAQQATRKELLGVYLNDHLAGAVAGSELARRMARAAQPGYATATDLPRLAAEIAEDRLALLKIMATLEIPTRGYKMFGAWAGEKIGRLKPNRHLLTRSPLSELEETEILRLGVDGKAAGWRTLRMLADRDSRLDKDRLDELLARADRQSGELETLRASIAKQVLTDGSG